MDVRLPNLGEGADSGSVVALHVKEGDKIKEGQIILELENEKAIAPIPSPAAGTVAKLRVKEGDKVSVGQVILSLEADGAPARAPATEPSPRRTAERAEPEPRPAAPEPGDSVAAPTALEYARPESQFPPPASPSVRKLARDLGIDLNRVRGSERGGRIVLEDLRTYIQTLQQIAFGRQQAQPQAPKPAAETIDFSKFGPVERKPMTSLRRTISQRMQEAWTTIPHVTQFDEADITALLELRKEQSAAFEKKGAKLTLTCFALKIVVNVLKKFPIFNASIDEAKQEIVFKNYYHIGLAVDTDAGLIVPVIRDVDKKDLLTLARELADLATKARERKVSLDDLKGGSFTISNQGGIGGAHFTPIVNKPEVAILGLGRGVLKPGVRDGKIEPRNMLPLCLSYDHRLIDGGQAARFIHELVAGFENPNEAELK